MPLTNKLILCGLLAGLITGTRSTGYAQSRPPANSAIAWTTGGTIEKGKQALRRSEFRDRVLHGPARASGGSYAHQQAGSAAESKLVVRGNKATPSGMSNDDHRVALRVDFP